MERIAILVVNGGPDPDVGRWIELFLERVAARTTEREHHLFVWNNNTDDRAVAELVRAIPHATYREPELGQQLTHVHGDPLQRLFDEAVDRGFDMIVTMDSDAFPVESGWLSELEAALDGGATIAGVWSDEQPEAPPFVHPSTMAVRSDWVREQGLRFDEFPEIRPGVQDTVIHFTIRALESGGRIHGWGRSNVNSYHRIMGALYGDRIYHHHAGSRPLVRFRYEREKGHDTLELRQANARLRDLATELVFRHRRAYERWLRGGGFVGEPASTSVEVRLCAYRRADAERCATLFEGAVSDGGRYPRRVPQGVHLARHVVPARDVRVVDSPRAATVVCYSAPTAPDAAWADWHRERLREAEVRPLLFVDVDRPVDGVLVPLGAGGDGTHRRCPDPAVAVGRCETAGLLDVAAGTGNVEFATLVRELLAQHAECERVKRSRPIRRFLSRVPIARGILWRVDAVGRRLRDEA